MTEAAYHKSFSVGQTFSVYIVMVMNILPTAQQCPVITFLSHPPFSLELIFDFCLLRIL